MSKPYHHGDLRAALVETSFEVLAECGLQKFSVAAVARRLGVSSAAPYRHFADRAHLLSAVSAVAARELRIAVEVAADETGPFDAERLAAVSGAYVRHAIRTGAGFHVIFAAELYAIPDDARRDETRALMSTLIDLAVRVAYEYPQALRLVEATIAIAHGYTSLYTDGFFSRNGTTVEAIAGRAVEATLALT